MKPTSLIFSTINTQCESRTSLVCQHKDTRSLPITDRIALTSFSLKSIFGRAEPLNPRNSSRSLRQLDRDSLWHKVRVGARHRAASGDRWTRTATVPDVHCPSKPRNQSTIFKKHVFCFLNLRNTVILVQI